ncbi:hypothetical protein BJ878DRAFT_530833 [Calycina marina]|uniref:Uncharacterized protein n=1 Tax=Calycina marina TaxID=1763456 RepID=A0A9P7YU91_9HELO|nr:hypothetical protein BJ878DRAFT_530833 [Calycina marina]
MVTGFPEVTDQRGREQLANATKQVVGMEHSLPNGFEEAPGFILYGSSAQNINTSSGIQHINSSRGNILSGSGQMHIGTMHIGTVPESDYG